MRCAAILIIITIGVAISCPGLAQDCLPRPPQHYFERATVVFSGVVVSIDEHPELYAINSEGLVEYEFQVGQVWKGPLDARFLVYSQAEWELHCGYELGGNYIVYARARKEEGDLLRVKCCGGPPLIHAGLVDRVVLGSAEIVDASIALKPPTEAELIRKTYHEDSRIAGKARAALDEYRKRVPDLK